MIRPLPPSGSNRRRRAPEDGDLEVFCADEQHDIAIEASRWATLAADVLGAEGIRGEAELSLLFVDVAAITELNERFMGAEGPTDVLAFPMEDDLIEMSRWPDATTTGPDRDIGDPEDAPLLLGDVVICPAIAAANAPEHAGSTEDELALLVVHGVLHVLGHDHAEPDEMARMQARERELLAQLHGPLGRDPWARDSSAEP